MLRWIHQIRIYFKILLNETENRQSDLKIQIRIALKERTHSIYYYNEVYNSRLRIQITYHFKT
jgi:hypothetical protein